MKRRDEEGIAGAITFRLRPPIGEEELNELFAASWPDHLPRQFGAALSRSLTYVGAFAKERLVGFVNLAWDGGRHAFLLDTTVDPEWRRRGIGRRLVAEAAKAAKEKGLHWIHVDYEPRYAAFYRACGFRPTEAGLMPLQEPGRGRSP